MEAYTRQDMRGALEALASMIERGQKAQAKFAPGTAQHTLQENRTAALRIAMWLIQRERGDAPTAAYTRQQLEKAAAPLASLASKSEKAREKLKRGTWQHTMLENNLNALGMAAPLLARALAEGTPPPEHAGSC